MRDLQKLQREATIKKRLTVRMDGTPRHVNGFLRTVSKMETVGFRAVPVMETRI